MLCACLSVLRPEHAVTLYEASWEFGDVRGSSTPSTHDCGTSSGQGCHRHEAQGLGRAAIEARHLPRCDEAGRREICVVCVPCSHRLHLQKASLASGIHHKQAVRAFRPVLRDSPPRSFTAGPTHWIDRRSNRRPARPMSLLLAAAREGDEQAVRELLAAGAAADDASASRWLPIHAAAAAGHLSIVQQLLQAVPATAFALSKLGWTPLHAAADTGRASVVQFLLEAAPVAVSVVDGVGNTPLDWALNCGLNFLPTARCLVQAADTVQPALDSIVQRGQDAATLYADLVSRLALTQQEWQSIPAPCPDLARALPAVMERSVSEAGWLVGRLGQEQRARLRTGALCLGRMAAGVHGAPLLPAQLSQRILVAALVWP